MKKIPLLPREDLKKFRLDAGPMAVAKMLVNAFSTTDRQRDPPCSPNKTIPIRLVTIGVSHYCEKVRWALDIIESRSDNPYYYTEEAHPPGFHAFSTLELSKGEASATPMIALEENGKQQQLLWQSGAILKRFLPELYPLEIKKEVEVMEADFGNRLGATSRCFCYHYLLADGYHKTMTQMCANPSHVTKVDHVLFDKMLDNGLNVGIRKMVGVKAETAAASLPALRAVFDEVSKRLEESGGDYIMDTKDNKSYGFTAADLTFAALASILLCPPELETWYVPRDQLPKEINDLAYELLETTAGKHALKIYKQHRCPNGERVVVMKNVDRNKYPWQGLGLGGYAFVTGVVAAAVGVVGARRR
jgi:glutathione S-transferase